MTLVWFAGFILVMNGGTWTKASIIDVKIIDADLDSEACLKINMAANVFLLQFKLFFYFLVCSF